MPLTGTGQLEIGAVIGAVTGAIIGGVIGGGTGARVGTAVGALGGAATPAAGRAVARELKKLTRPRGQPRKTRPVLSLVPLFPWPPPAPSAAEVLPKDLLGGTSQLNMLADLNTTLIKALEKNGYFERSYYAVPYGFALATRVEQIDRDGASMPLPDRWLPGPPTQAFSIDNLRNYLRNYFRKLLTANPAYYRVIVFIVSDEQFVPTTAQISKTEAEEWLGKGTYTLPTEIAEKLYTAEVQCTVLVYEFKLEEGQEPKYLQPGHLDAHTHLTKSGIWQSL